MTLQKHGAGVLQAKEARHLDGRSEHRDEVVFVEFRHVEVCVEAIKCDTMITLERKLDTTAVTRPLNGRDRGNGKVSQQPVGTTHERTLPRSRL